MSVKLSAVVRPIEIDTEVYTSEWKDTFTELMREKVGETIQIENKFNDTFEWFDGLDNMFNWHISWLKDFKNVE